MLIIRQLRPLKTHHTRKNRLSECYGCTRSLLLLHMNSMDAPAATEPIKSQLCHVFCDESRQQAERFMVLGGAVVEAEERHILEAKIAAVRATHNLKAEMKWGKVSKAYLPKYKAFLDVFFDANQINEICFHAIVIDTHEIDHDKFNDGDKEIGFYKFFYQLLLHSFGKNYCRHQTNDRFQVFMDYRNSSYSLNLLRDILNAAMKKKFNIATNPFRTIEPIDSHKSDILQFVDILAGAIGFQKNGCHALPGASPAKIELMQFILTKTKLVSLANGTPYSRRNFTIWNFRLKK